MTEIGDTIVFSVPRDMLGRLMKGDMALDTQDGIKLGFDVQEIEPSEDEDTRELNLVVTAVVTHIDED